MIILMLMACIWLYPCVDRRYGSGDSRTAEQSNVQEVRVLQSAQKEARFSKTGMNSGSHSLDLYDFCMQEFQYVISHLVKRPR